MHLLRPLIGMGKDEIVKLAQRIGTYGLSTRLPEYCAVFSRRLRRWATREEVEEMDLAIRDAVEEVVKSMKILRKRELDEYVKSLTPPQDLEIGEFPPDAVVVDLRDGESYRRWHLPGAVRADPEDVFSLVDRMGRDKTHVFYCYGGGLSLDVAESLRKLGIRAYSIRLWRTSSQAQQRDTTSREEIGGDV